MINFSNLLKYYLCCILSSAVHQIICKSNLAKWGSSIPICIFKNHVMVCYIHQNYLGLPTNLVIYHNDALVVFILSELRENAGSMIAKAKTKPESVLAKEVKLCEANPRFLKFVV